LIKRIALIISILHVFAANAQTNYWQQQVNYKMDVALDLKAKSILGDASIEYINQSPDTLQHIWFHLYANAYINGKTAYAKQLGREPLRIVRANNSGKGYMDQLKFSVDSIALQIENDSENPDIIKLNLRNALLPNQKVVIKASFHVQLPPLGSRSGYVNNQFLICQWYPKPAVYDKRGWHVFPYLEFGEYYSDYGTYDVNITVPSEYVVAATGSLQDENELKILKTIGAFNAHRKGATPQFYKNKNDKENKTLHFKAENVSDFAWFADKEFIVNYDTTKLQSGQVIDLFSFYHQRAGSKWERSTLFVKDAIQHYSSWLGEYAYPVASVVECPSVVSYLGMEYPMISVISTMTDGPVVMLDATIAHEVGHNWFMAMLGSNERDFPWMDEGMNSFYQYRYEAKKYKTSSLLIKGDNTEGQTDLQKFTGTEIEKAVYDLTNQQMKESTQSIQLDSPFDFDSFLYYYCNYIKAPLWLNILEDDLGAEKFDEAMHLYFKRWRFKHPYPYDFQKVLEEVAGRSLDSIFALLKKRGRIRQL
jgi:hypothetical protein